MKFNIPSDDQLRTIVKGQLTASGLSQRDYAEKIGVSRDGLQKFLLDKRDATLEFARRLLQL